MSERPLEQVAVTGNLLEGGREGKQALCSPSSAASTQQVLGRETLVINAREGSNSINAAEHPAHLQRENLVSVSVK